MAEADKRITETQKKSPKNPAGTRAQKEKGNTEHHRKTHKQEENRKPKLHKSRG